MHASSFSHAVRLIIRTMMNGCANTLRDAAACIFACVVLSFTPAAHGAEAFTVEATRQGDAVQVQTSATVRAPLAVIWHTLTDYDHLSEFIPGMTTSHLVERQGKTARVEQSGYARLWFFKFPIDVTVEAIEQSPSVMTVHLVKGNLRQLDGSYHIEKIGDDVYSVRWAGLIAPDSNVPIALTTPLLRKNIAEQFLGMINEIERRASTQPRS